MKVEQVSAKLGKAEDALKMSVDFEVPETLQECIDKFGEEVTLTRARASIIIDLQAYLRSHMKVPDMTSEKLQELTNSWMPGTRARGKSAAEKIASLFDGLSAEEKAVILESFVGSDA